MATSRKVRNALLATGFASVAWLASPEASSHCDRLDGPVVAAASAALAKGEMSPVLKWVRKEHEAEVRASFEKTLAVRSGGPEARDLAATYFFETVVRLHRAGEGASYTGLEAAGSDLDPAVAGADTAIESGSVEVLVDLVAGHVRSGIRQRFQKALEAKKHSEESVEAGRRFVETYVEFVHYVERLHQDAVGAANDRERGGEPDGR